MRSWSAASEFKRRTMQRSDVATAIARTGGTGRRSPVGRHMASASRGIAAAI